VSDVQTISEAEAFDTAAKPDAGDVSTRAEPAKDEWDGWDGPGYVKQWKKPSQSAIRELRRLDAENKFLPAVLKEVEDRYDYTGKQQAEFDKYRKRFDPYSEVIGSLEQRFALQGVHPAAGLQQMAAVSDLLYRDPDQALGMLLNTFRPRDAKALISSLAQSAGIDLGSLAADKPWVDPAVQNLIAPLQQQFQQMNGFLQQQFQAQHQQASQQLANTIKAFKEATNADGSLKYPHYAKLEPLMTQVLKATGITDLEKLYEQASYLDPEVREQMIEDRARKAEAKAIQDAKEQQASVEEAARASRNITGSKTVPLNPKPKNQREQFDGEWERLSRR
jgi:hypothetical protein